jgi:hypothetical protein
VEVEVELVPQEVMLLNQEEIHHLVKEEMEETVLQIQFQVHQ